MNFLSNYSTRAKLLLGFGLMIVLLLAVSATAYRNAEQLKQSQEVLFQEDLSVAFNLMALRNAINRERVVLLSLALTEQSGQTSLLQQLERERTQVLEILKKLEKHRDTDAAFASKLDRIQALRQEFVTVRDRDVMPALNNGKRNEASAAIIGPLQTRFQALREIADEAGEQQFAEAEKRMLASEAVVSDAQKALILANLIAIALGLGLVFWLDRIIARPLKEVTGMAQQIATGNLNVSIPAANGNDEVGQLLRALDAMVASWRQMIRETNAGIATLSAAASEILAGTTQVASGVSETAAAVSETTATVEEVKQTALLASQKARTVSDMAQRAAHTVETGRKSIEGGVEGMETVQEQMESIAETIVKLSDRSQAIAEIVATVGGLADQSNLLAVNAAIEAAKAGEQGKGFAVVAQEIRDLAEQSRQATRQVRQILGEIQKAISAAVMTTEQGARAVASGVEQAAEAGNAFKSLSEGIADAAQAAAQIAATSQQQLAGMDQVAMAMENIKQVSVENAAGSRQSEASAQNLHELGQKLKEVSERFKL
ncbi:methyl-accepting chemotaxis protein [Paucimonas lemoignei]|uniref:Methyl-accepting chemotaxis protein n=1 Tax=Paucimonas lemoignei TaxID=29443 RepID=A0A4R3I1H7_PAULE|nr:methyl-accepting chemotaxis protein [Paucimonas lemoignei]TCS38455.1 methyl-accepting chemotaxis protein [Paucimonas lemoignei]